MKKTNMNSNTGNAPQFNNGDIVVQKGSTRKMTVLKYSFKGSPALLENVKVVATWIEGEKFKVSTFSVHDLILYTW